MTTHEKDAVGKSYKDKKGPELGIEEEGGGGQPGNTGREEAVLHPDPNREQ